MSKHTEIKCPICAKTVVWNEQAPWRPFCSQRCRLIDLGQWASEDYRIPGRPAAPDEFQQEPQDG